MYTQREMEKEYDFLIVGAGLAGSTFAYIASKNGKRCAVIDRRKTIAGNLWQKEINGIWVHWYGAHIFRTDDRKIWDFVNRFSDFHPFINCPIANYNGKLYNLPFNMNTFYQMWGTDTPQKAKEKINAQRKPCETPANLEEWALDTVGRDIYQTFIKDYTEKQWGKPCRELPAEIMKRIPLRFTFDNNYFHEKYQGIPVKGYNHMIGKMLEKSDVFLSVSFKDARINARQIVYTGALDELYDYCFGPLEWRSLRFEHNCLPTQNFQGVAVMNYTGKEPFTRIIEHKHFLPGNQPVTVISREYPDEWNPRKEPYYPVNDQRNISLQTRYAERAKKDGYIVLGRLGEYRYFDMQDTIKSVFRMAKEMGMTV